MNFLLSVLLFIALSANFVSASTGTWKGTSVTETIMPAVWTFPNGTVMLVAEDSGANKYIERSDDGGNTFRGGNLVNNAVFMFDLAMADFTSGAISGVSIGLPADSYTTDGVNWEPSTWPALKGKFIVEQIQSMQLVGGVTGGFGVTGPITNTQQGVGISMDGAKTYTFYPIPFQTFARCGAFPSATTWYATAGNFPNNSNSVSDGILNWSPRVKIPLGPSHKTLNVRRRGLGDAGAPVNLTNSLYAEIWKTTDGGKTFTQIFNSTQWYANDIRCVDEMRCFVLLESFTNSVVWGTKDGGMTWQQLYEDATGSLVIGQIVSEDVWYVGGGGQNGHVAFTLDGGNTWTMQKIPDTVVFDISMANSSYGFFVGPNVLQEFQLFKYD